ncbi:MAG: hypothetical protein Kow0090_15570 [Myxococcota bacterium]
MREISSLLDDKDIEGALVVCEEAMESFPNDRDLTVLYLELLLAADRREEGLEKAEEFLLAFNYDGDIMLSYASALFENLRFEETLETLLKCLSIDGGNYEVFYLIANVLAHLGAEEQALLAMKTATAIAPSPIAIYPPLKPQEISDALSEAVESFTDELKLRLDKTRIIIEKLPTISELTAGERQTSPSTFGLKSGDVIKLFKYNLEWGSNSYQNLILNLADTLAYFLEKVPD